MDCVALALCAPVRVVYTVHTKRQLLMLSIEVLSCSPF